MISLIRAAWQEEMRVPMFVGLATDGYPDSDDPAMKNGARCYHMDTGAEYEYSKDDDAWYPVPSGGGGWPSDLPKPSVGGYGYTEQGEQTVIIWDGDTEGRVKHPAAGLYFVSDKYIDADSIDGAKATFSNGEEYIFERDDCNISEEDGVVILTATSSIDIPVESGVTATGPFIMSISEEYGGILPKGTYLSWTDTTGETTPLTEPFYTKTIEFGSETIHKIDEKYLPEGGGGAMVVVPCTVNPETMDAELTDTGVAVMDKINTDYQNGNIYPVICKMSTEFGGLSVDQYVNLNVWGVEDGSVVLSFASNDVRGNSFVSSVVKIGKVSDEWTVQILTASITLDQSAH